MSGRSVNIPRPACFGVSMVIGERRFMKASPNKAKVDISTITPRHNRWQNVCPVGGSPGTGGGGSGGGKCIW